MPEQEQESSLASDRPSIEYRLSLMSEAEYSLWQRRAQRKGFPTVRAYLNWIDTRVDAAHAKPGLSVAEFMKKFGLGGDDVQA